MQKSSEASQNSVKWLFQKNTFRCLVISVIFICSRNLEHLQTEQRTVIDFLQNKRQNIRLTPPQMWLKGPTWSVTMLACKRAGDGDHIGKLWSPLLLYCKWLAVIERYQFICCSLMTHEIKKYLLHRSSAHCVSVCVFRIRLPWQQPIHPGHKLWRRVAGGGLCRECLYACHCLYQCVKLVRDIFICVWQQDVQTDVQHGWSDLSSHSFDSSEGKNYCCVPTGSRWHFIVLNLRLISNWKKNNLFSKSSEFRALKGNEGIEKQKMKQNKEWQKDWKR